MKGRTDVRTYVRTYVVRTDVDDVMAIKPNFLTSIGYHIFLTMVLRARAPLARAELRYYQMKEFIDKNNLMFSSQYDFRKSHSTEHAILDIVEAILSNMDQHYMRCLH